MSWIDYAILLGLVVGIACGGVLLVTRGDLLTVYATKALQLLWPQFLKLVPKITAWLAKRNTPEVEEAMRECVRRGGEWDNFRKKCKF